MSVDQVRHLTGLERVYYFVGSCLREARIVSAMLGLDVSTWPGLLSEARDGEDRLVTPKSEHLNLGRRMVRRRKQESECRGRGG